MIQTFNEILAYVKNPVLQEDPNTDNSYRFKKFGSILVISLLTAMVSLLLIGLVDATGLVDVAEAHKAEEMLKSLPKIAVFMLVVVMAPLIEESIFRAPLTLFSGRKVFRIAFYVFAILFGYVHITNYEISTNVLLLSPILVLPQILLGFYLGFIRIRFGFLWAIALHAAYNGILTVGSFIGEALYP